MASAAPPEIQGAKQQASEAEERVERQEVGEEAAELALPVPLPAEETATNRDIEEKESISEKIETAEKANKKKLSEKQAAQLANARAKRAEKKRIREAEGKQGAQGTPSPNLLADFSSLLESSMSTVLKRLDAMETRLPYEAPTQVNHYVPPSQVQPTEATASNSTLVPVASKDDARVGQPLPDHIANPPPPKRVRFSQDPHHVVHDQELIHRRNAKALNSISYYNQAMQARADQHPNEMGARHVERAETNFFTW